MTHTELCELIIVLQGIANGAEWECMWNREDGSDGWGNPLGRDVECCLKNRIPMRLKPEPERSVEAELPDFFDAPTSLGGAFAPTLANMGQRDVTALVAMLGYLVGRNSNTSFPGRENHHNTVAKSCYKYADAMIAAGKETP